MIRPFHLRDLALVYRLGERGVVLQAEAALTTVPHPTRRALVNIFLGGQYNTYVWKSDDRTAVGFVQLSWKEKEPSARIAYLGAERNGGSPNNTIDEDTWLALLDQLVIETGKDGVNNLIAEAAEEGPELPVLRKAGFVVYTREDIWICEEPAADGVADLLQPHRSIDEWDIQVLYANNVPGLIQSVEPGPPLGFGNNWVLREEEDLAAFVHVKEGPVASWLRVLIHPNARTKPKEIIKFALQVSQPTEEHPIYCSVRRYQSWLQSPLEKAGFRWWGSQAVMVKQIVQPVSRLSPAKTSRWEAQPVPGSSTLIQGFTRHNEDVEESDKSAQR